MVYTKNQKVLVRKKIDFNLRQNMSLQQRINDSTFAAEIIDIDGNELELCKIDSNSFYGFGDIEKHRIDLNSTEYDVQPLRAEPVFQVDAIGGAIF